MYASAYNAISVAIDPPKMRFLSSTESPLYCVTKNATMGNKKNAMLLALSNTLLMSVPPIAKMRYMYAV